MTSELSYAALIVIDVQQGFDDVDFWGSRNNAACEANIAMLVEAWVQAGWPVVYVQHDSANPESPLHPLSQGNQLKSFLEQHVPALSIRKTVNSAFLGTPNLHQWLTEQSVTQVVITGITTNHCCETTARFAGNLGYETWFVADATHTFDRMAPDGRVVSAQELAYITATNLHGEFAEVVSTAHIVNAIAPRIA